MFVRAVPTPLEKSPPPEPPESDPLALKILNEGIGKSGQPLYSMPWRYYAGMSDPDKRALIAALRVVPPVVNAVQAAGFSR